MKVTELRNGQVARIKKIDMPEKEQLRLFHIGFYRGARIQKLMLAPLHDPILFFVQGNQVILRIEDAKHIEVEEIV